MEISKGRQILKPDDLDMWQKDTEAYLLSNPVLAECFQDPSRLFNQDETSIELGSSDRRVLAKKGTKVICHVSSGSKEHSTVWPFIFLIEHVTKIVKNFQPLHGSGIILSRTSC